MTPMPMSAELLAELETLQHREEFLTWLAEQTRLFELMQDELKRWGTTLDAVVRTMERQAVERQVGLHLRSK